MCVFYGATSNLIFVTHIVLYHLEITFVRMRVFMIVLRCYYVIWYLLYTLYCIDQKFSPSRTYALDTLDADRRSREERKRRRRTH